MSKQDVLPTQEEEFESRKRSLQEISTRDDGGTAEKIDKTQELDIFDYFAQGIQEPWKFDNAQKRIWRNVMARPGIIRLNHATFPERARELGLAHHEELYVPRDLARKFIDMERILHGLNLFTLNGALGGEAMRQIYFMAGPAGVAKSLLTEEMRYSLNDTPVYYLKGCPLRESPLLITPRWSREEYSRKLGVFIHPTKDVCGVCRYNLEHEYGKDWRRFPVMIETISTRRNIGSASVPPFDPMTQSSDVLIGAVDYFRTGNLMMHERWNLKVGAFAQAMGGILEFREILKAVLEVRNLLLIATQEQEFPAPEYQEWFSSDFMIMAHANIPEVVRWKANTENDAFFDRIYASIVPYSLAWEREMRIQDLMLSRSRVRQEDVDSQSPYDDDERAERALIKNPQRLIDDAITAHASPGARSFGAKFDIASRLEPPPQEGSQSRAWESVDQLFRAINLLNGEGEPEAVAQYRREHPTDGLKGISTRFSAKALGDAQAEALLRAGQSHACWNIDDVRRRLRSHLETERTFVLEANSRKDVARIEALLNFLDGDFTEYFFRRLKRQLYHDLRESGVLSTVIGTREFDRRRQGMERFMHALAVLRERAGREGEGGTTQDVDKEYRDAIVSLMGINPSAVSEVQAELLQEWSNWNESGRNLNLLGTEEDDVAMLRRAWSAISEYVYQTHAEEFCRDTLDYMRGHQANTQKIDSEVISKLDHYCVSCLTWALEKCASPFVREAA